MIWAVASAIVRSFTSTAPPGAATRSNSFHFKPRPCAPGQSSTIAWLTNHDASDRRSSDDCSTTVTRPARPAALTCFRIASRCFTDVASVITSRCPLAASPAGSTTGVPAAATCRMTPPAGSEANGASAPFAPANSPRTRAQIHNGH
ncbi:MAG: hypothetical protein ABSH20_32135, partial [Tepidisphaeraceae bacterium]